ncbi:RNase A-like domain-containing protein [Streptomyces sp. URMC 123]|uniref:RNase A-like domain-containing protein n=1 Tax=Streptomyces sp. URMC 123 TaxID=3423403 RepID=UPI003F1BE2EF
MGSPPPAPAGSPNGTIDVKPSHLYGVSDKVAQEQGALHKSATDFLTDLNKHPDAGGAGAAAEAFAKSYVKVGNRFLEVFARTVVSIGGAAVGFTTTANNYVAADAATNPKQKTPPSPKPLPQVIENEPRYGAVPNLTWGDHDEGETFLDWVFEGVAEAAAKVLRPLFKHVYRYGAAADVLPLPNQHELDSLSKAWLRPRTGAHQVNENLTTYMNGITSQSNSEWHNAMRSFCSSVWGTSAWGKGESPQPATSAREYGWKHHTVNSRGASYPILAVITDTCNVVSDALRLFSEAARDLNHDLWRIFRKALMDALPKLDVDLKDGVDMGDVKGAVKGIFGVAKKGLSQLSMGMVLELDTAAINAAVARYNNRVNPLVTKLDNRLAALDEAYLSAPRFDAQSARAEAFGARALNEFKREHKWTVPGDKAADHMFPIDLANQEHIDGSHVIDKHVGKSDEQLNQRLRDQSGIPAASTYKNLADAQKYTQKCIEENWDDINTYINGPPPISPATKLFYYTPTTGEITGRTVTATAYAADNNTPAVDAHGVQIRVKPAPGMHPPFTIVTSMPK